MDFEALKNEVLALPADERRKLMAFMVALQDEQRLLPSLDEAVRDIDAGKGVAIDDVRKRVGTWVATYCSRP